jgi:lysosomal acid lipase/cholesteryl ester hydrolase
MAEYDVVDMVEYVKLATGFEKVGYVAHSMGTTMMFYLATKEQDWVTNSISVFTALAPVTMPTHSGSKLIKKIAPQIGLLDDLLKWSKVYELFQPTQFSKSSMRIVCGYLPWICKAGASAISDKNLDADNEERFQVYMGGHYPSGTSTKSLVHYAQMIKAEKFQQFDLGSEDLNMGAYG